MSPAVVRSIRPRCVACVSRLDKALLRGHPTVHSWGPLVHDRTLELLPDTVPLFITGINTGLVRARRGGEDH